MTGFISTVASNGTISIDGWIRMGLLSVPCADQDLGIRSDRVTCRHKNLTFISYAIGQTEAAPVADKPRSSCDPIKRRNIPRADRS